MTIDTATQEERLSATPVGEAALELGRRLRDARTYLGLTQEFVAEQLGVPRASISAMESGKRKVSGLEVRQLAALYKQPVTFFLSPDHHAADQEGVMSDETFRALFRTARDLSDNDRQQVLRFAQFLRQAGRAPIPPPDVGES